MTAAAKKAAASPMPDSSDGEPAKGGKTYKVSAPLVAVTVGEQVLQYSNGDVLPSGVSKDSLDLLTSLGFIAED